MRVLPAASIVRRNRGRGADPTTNCTVHFQACTNPADKGTNPADKGTNTADKGTNTACITVVL